MARFGFLMALTLPLLALLGMWIGNVGLFFVPLLIWILLPIADLLVGRNKWNPDPAEYENLRRDPWFRSLLLFYVPLHFAVIALGVWVLLNESLAWFQVAGLVLTVGTVTGGVGITVAHELGHRFNRTDRFFAWLLLASVCYMHFLIEHNRGHHVRVATPEDPASARLGEGLYAFYVRTIAGSFTHAWKLERARLAKRGIREWSWRNGMLWCVAVPLAIVLTLLFAWGWAAVGFFLAQAVVAFSLLEIVNYLEHYGLQRRRLPDGSYEQVSALHSWNSSERLSSYFLFNLTRHSHHHVQVQRQYQILEHLEESPQLPTGYAGMILVALIPPLWRAIMDRRLAPFRAI